MSIASRTWRSSMMKPNENILLRIIVLKNKNYVEYFGEYCDGIYHCHVSQEGEFPITVKPEKVYAWRYMDLMVSKGQLLKKIKIINF